MSSARGWKRSFDDPIPLPRGRQIVTLEDAGNYITRLPKAEHEAAEWQAAMEGLDPGRDADAGLEPRQVRSGDRTAPQARKIL